MMALLNSNHVANFFVYANSKMAYNYGSITKMEGSF